MKNSPLIFAVVLCGCMYVETPVEPVATKPELDVTSLSHIDNKTSSISYKASIVDGVHPRVHLFVNDTWEIPPTVKVTRGNFEYGTIVYPTEKPPIPVLYAFWGDTHKAITIGPER